MGLLDAVGERPLRSAFLRGWLAGVGYFGVGCWWIVEPFFVDAKNQAWMAPIALPLMAGGLALFWGAAGLAYRLAARNNTARVLVFAGCFALLEWLRGHVLTGFPWDLPGEAWRAGSAPSQAASLVGAYGLSWLTLALGAAPALLLDRTSRAEKAITAAVIAGFVGLLYAYGAIRISQAPTPAPGAPLIRVVQADIDQKDKWKPENLASIFETYVSLSRKAGPAHPDIVVWPEGALPAVIDELVSPGSPYGPRLRDALDPGQTLLMGANRAEARPGETDYLYFNSLIAFRREAEGLRVTAIYDKYRLVPFGEYMPLGKLATKVGFRSLVHMPDDFTAGPEPKPVTPWGVPAVQPLICYEALFPGFTRAAAVRSGLRPAWILNVSNDAWFGRTSGPLQHLNMASYRAIEEGLPIVRATPTGVSAVIDAFGRTQSGARLGLGELGVIDARLPPALRPTLYARFGDTGFALMLVLSALVIVANRFQRPMVD
ncbi:apolipoprotein N-acyltransferase [Phenylobacterium soli]|uniref:Apolipoprotein N-acyltransferase n=2 Tax=Phenylobacterium soli TaxID=2170551 RepID=A0A328APE9_9CAUL|nr:apolipoprotein N-acyltransferase [Phenylobacterium soli]